MNIVHCGGFFDTPTHHDTSKNETIILLFVQQNASDSVSDVHIGVSKHIFFCLGVYPTARDAVKVEVLISESRKH